MFPSPLATCLVSVIGSRGMLVEFSNSFPENVSERVKDSISLFPVCLNWLPLELLSQRTPRRVDVRPLRKVVLARGTVISVCFWAALVCWTVIGSWTRTVMLELSAGFDLEFVALCLSLRSPWYSPGLLRMMETANPSVGVILSIPKSEILGGAKPSTTPRIVSTSVASGEAGNIVRRSFGTKAPFSSHVENEGVDSMMTVFSVLKSKSLYRSESNEFRTSLILPKMSSGFYRPVSTYIYQIPTYLDTLNSMNIEFNLLAKLAIPSLC